MVGIALKNWKMLAGAALVILILVMAWRIDALKGDRKELKRDKAEIQQTLKDTKAALGAAQASSRAQIEELERVSLTEKARADSLNQILKEIEASNETVDCPMPDFMRRAFERM